MTTLDDAELEKVVWQAYKSWSDDPDRGKYPEKTLVAHTIKALKQIRDARLVGPGDEDVEIFLESPSDDSIDWEEWDAGFRSGCQWLRSQLRLEPAPTSQLLEPTSTSSSPKMPTEEACLAARRRIAKPMFRDMISRGQAIQMMFDYELWLKEQLGLGEK